MKIKILFISLLLIVLSLSLVTPCFCFESYGVTQSVVGNNYSSDNISAVDLTELRFGNVNLSYFTNDDGLFRITVGDIHNSFPYEFGALSYNTDEGTSNTWSVLSTFNDYYSPPVPGADKKTLGYTIEMQFTVRASLSRRMAQDFNSDNGYAFNDPYNFVPFRNVTFAYLGYLDKDNNLQYLGNDSSGVRFTYTTTDSNGNTYSPLDYYYWNSLGDYEFITCNLHFEIDFDKLPSDFSRWRHVRFNFDGAFFYYNPGFEMESALAYFVAQMDFVKIGTVYVNSADYYDAKAAYEYSQTVIVDFDDVQDKLGLDDMKVDFNFSITSVVDYLLMLKPEITRLFTIMATPLHITYRNYTIDIIDSYFAVYASLYSFSIIMAILSGSWFKR